jgi:hypothetical protein
LTAQPFALFGVAAWDDASTALSVEARRVAVSDDAFIALSVGSPIAGARDDASIALTVEALEAAGRGTASVETAGKMPRTTAVAEAGIAIREIHMTI